MRSTGGVLSTVKTGGVFSHQRHSRAGSVSYVSLHHNKHKARRQALAVKCVATAIFLMVMWKVIALTFVENEGLLEHPLPSMVTLASKLDVVNEDEEIANTVVTYADFDTEENNETISGSSAQGEEADNEGTATGVSTVASTVQAGASGDNEEQCAVDNGIKEAKEEFFQEVRHKQIFTRKQLLCKLKELKPKFVTENSAFLANWTKWKQLVPQKPPMGFFNTCAVVSNSGAMLGSGMGYAIDNHDLILRFNDGPSLHHESDVGSKNATWRLINGQLPLRWGNHSKRLMESFLLPEKSVLIFWHHCCCGISSMKDCVELQPNSTGMIRKTPKDGDDSPDGFRAYFQLIDEYFDKDIHLLDFEYVFEIWQFLKAAYGRALAAERPPSSGFLGIMTLMHYCNHIDAYEFVPSKIRHPLEVPLQCHYYNPDHHLMNMTSNHTCDIYGHERWHPLYAEKSLLYQLNVAEDQQVFQGGVIRLPGLSQVDCASDDIGNMER